jgi:TM2 domain-containing membrane protein YozV
MVSPDKLKIVEVEFLRHKKDTLTAYIFLVFFWFIGLHKFYLGKNTEGVIFLSLPVLSSVFTIFGFFMVNDLFFYSGLVLAGGFALVFIFDLFTLWKQVEKANERIYRDIFEKITGIPYSSVFPTV